MFKCKYRKICGHYDKKSHTCNIYPNSYCGIYRELEQDEIIKKGKIIKPKKRCNYIMSVLIAIILIRKYRKKKKQKEKNIRDPFDFFREGISDALGISPDDITDDEINKSLKSMKRIEN